MKEHEHKIYRIVHGDIFQAEIKCACGSMFTSYLEFSKHVNALDDFDLASTHDWLRRQVQITQNEMDKRRLQ